MLADLKTVTRMLENGKPMALRYVGKDGNIRDMLVSKRRPAYPQRKSSRPSQAFSPNMKTNALIPVKDHLSGGQFKNIFMFGIIAYNAEGDLKNMHTIKRGVNL